MSQPFAIILAAGASTRMGRCKTALPWGSQTLLSLQAAQWLEAGFTPVVVLAPHNAHCHNCPAGTWVQINPNPSRGKTSSLHIGLAAIPPTADPIAIAAVDQPRSTEIYLRLFQAHCQHNSLISAPLHVDRLGHPLLFSHRLRSQLAEVQEETQGMRQLVKCYDSQIQRVPFSTPIVLSDLNTPAAYERFRQNWTEEHRTEPCPTRSQT